MAATLRDCLYEINDPIGDFSVEKNCGPLSNKITSIQFGVKIMLEAGQMG
jgi:hypothetical protein